MGQGGAPLFSIARGRGDREEAGRIMGNSMTLLLTSSVALALIVRWISRPVLLALGAGEQTIGYAEEYLHFYLIGTPLVFVTLGMNPYVNAQGFARRGMMTVLLGAAANIALDPVFIFTLGMGVKGAAVATVLSQLISAAWCTSFLGSRKAVLPLRWEYMGLRGRIVSRIVSMGVSNFVTQGTNSVIQAVANRQLGIHGGDLFIGAMTIINALRTSMIQVVHGITHALQPVLGYNSGAGRKDRVLEGIRFATGICAGYLLLFWALVELFPAALARIFTGEAELIAVTVPSMRIYYCGIFLMSLQLMAQSAFQGLGRAKQAVFFSMFRKVIIEAPLMVLLPRLGGLGVNGVFWAEPVSDLVGGAAAFGTMLATVYFPIQRQLRKETT